MNTPTQCTLASLTDSQVYFGLDWVLECFEDRPLDRLTLWDALWHEWIRRQHGKQSGEQLETPLAV